MAIVDEKQRSALIEKALEAIKESVPEKGHKICREIVETIASLCHQNQKEIAQELQTLAKALETASSENEAFEFKQKTCAIMLEISMEERRKARLHGQAAAPASTPVSAPVQAPTPTPAPPQESQPPHPQPVTDPPRNKIIGLPSQTSVPQTGISSSNSSSSSNFFSSPSTGKIIGASTPAATEAASADITGGAVLNEAGELPQETEGLPETKKPPFKNLAYLYLGTDDYEATVEYYLDVLHAEKVWDFDRFGARVTAFKVSSGPLLLISNHRKAPSCQPVFEVDDLSLTIRELKERGFKEQAGPFGTPNGEAYSFLDPGGNSFAIFQVDPDSTDRSYVDPTEY
ncbi:hypothetical protein GC174_09370 [bacterium]|nr:hypothetical protein [bacterium]